MCLSIPLSVATNVAKNPLLAFFTLLCQHCENTPNRNTDYSLRSLICSFGRNWITSVMFLMHVYINTNAVFGSDAAVDISHFFLRIPVCSYIVVWIFEILFFSSFIWFTETSLLCSLLFVGLHTLWLLVFLESAGDDGRFFLSSGFWQDLPASSLLILRCYRNRPTFSCFLQSQRRRWLAV